MLLERIITHDKNSVLHPLALIAREDHRNRMQKNLPADNMKYHGPVHIYDLSYIQKFTELFNGDSVSFAYANEFIDLNVR